MLYDLADASGEFLPAALGSLVFWILQYPATCD
jgi:hypothetical protein